MTSQKQNALRQEGARNTYRGPDYRAAWQVAQAPVAAVSGEILAKARARLERDPINGLCGFSREVEAMTGVRHDC